MNDLFVSLFKTLVWDNVVEAVLARLFLAVPLLGWGPIGIVVAWIVKTVGDKIFTGVKTFVDITAIKLNNEAAQKEFDRANIRLRLIAEDEGIESPAFKEARENDKKALSKFVRFGVARDAA